MKRLHTWASSHVHSPYADSILGGLIFIESFFLVPITTLLSFYCLERPKRVFFFAAIASTASFLGSMVGYSLGMLLHNFWDTLGEGFLSRFFSKTDFENYLATHDLYNGTKLLLATLTPLPFKLLTLSAGFCRAPLARFLLYTFLGRTVKFFAIATAFHFFGERVMYYVNRYLYALVALLAGVSLVFIILSYYRG